MFKSFIFLFLISLASGQVWANCDAVVEEMSKEETPTTSFLALLQNMIEKQYMSVDQYQILINSIEAGKIKIPWNQGNLSAHSSLRLYGNLVADYLSYWREHPEYLEKESVLKIGKENLQKWGREAVERSEAKDETKISMLKIESVKIPAGKLLLDNESRELVLSHDVEVQKYLVTQSMWVELMGENPSHFTKEGDEIKVNINGKDVIMQPNHPVENITLYSAMVYANKLSEKEGFNPVYDFSQVTTSTGRAESGKLNASRGKIVINETDGYRLPNREEAEYLMRGGTTTKYSFGDDESLLNQYGWFAENSDQQTHAVAEKLPNSFGLYDVHGNVWEFSPDSGDQQLIGSFRPLVGGSWNNFATSLESANCHFLSPSTCYSYVGFRLLRRLGKP